jgi:hypothetical protein
MLAATVRAGIGGTASPFRKSTIANPLKKSSPDLVNREGGIPDKEMQTCLQSIAPKGTVSNRSRLRQEAVNVSLTRIAAELGVKPNSLRTCRDGAAGQGRFAGFSAKSYTCVASARSCL